MGNMIWFQTYSYTALIHKISMFDNIKILKLMLKYTCSVLVPYGNIFLNLKKKKLPKFGKDEKFTFSPKETSCALKSSEHCIQLLIVFIQ